jgi:hypothetical protein
MSQGWLQRHHLVEFLKENEEKPIGSLPGYVAKVFKTQTIFNSSPLILTS